MCSVCIITELQPPGFKNKLSQSSSRKSSSNTHARVRTRARTHTTRKILYTEIKRGYFCLETSGCKPSALPVPMICHICTQATDSGKSSVLVKPASRLHSLGSSRELWQVWQSTRMTRWQTLMWRAGEKFCAKANIPAPCDCRGFISPL